MTSTAIVDQINKILLSRLQKAGCTTGHLTCEAPSGTLIISMHGHKPEMDKPIFFWQWEPPFTKLAWAYMESFQPELKAFSVEVDVPQRTCRYHNTNAPAYKRDQQASAKQREKEEQERKLVYKRELATQTASYGLPLAQAVAIRLQQGATLGYTHRDYCGTGLQYNSKGQFEYVELWDYAPDVLQAFDNEKAFVQWLSQQSDASLALLDAASSFYWGNQTITRKRLEAFVEEAVGK
jgi:hypothetical protein